MATKGIGLPRSSVEEPNEATMKRGVRENKRPVTSVVQRLGFPTPTGSWKKHTPSSMSRHCLPSTPSDPGTGAVPLEAGPFSEAVFGFSRISELVVLPSVLAVAQRASRSMWRQRELPVMVLELVPKAGAGPQCGGGEGGGDSAVQAP